MLNTLGKRERANSMTREILETPTPAKYPAKVQELPTYEF